MGMGDVIGFSMEKVCLVRLRGFCVFVGPMRKPKTKSKQKILKLKNKFYGIRIYFWFFALSILEEVGFFTKYPLKFFDEYRKKII